jgi:antirestriction protein
MKNIHLLPTDKPSRLHLWADEKGTRLELCELEYSHTRNTQHIYITNNDEMKEGDYGMLGKSIFSYRQMHRKWGMAQGQKIILTTDQDLIKDGVQAIDEKFLEWFVNNPSCEEVKIVDDVECLPMPNIHTHKHIYKIIIPKEEPKQETLEEAAERYSKRSSASVFQEAHKRDFIAGAKYHAERMYSEEDMRLAFETGRNFQLMRLALESGRNFQLTVEDNFNKLIEQFKKK